MKNSIIAAVALLPCLAIINESDSLLPNTLGLVYAACLYSAVKFTKRGRAFFRGVIRENARLQQKIQDILCMATDKEATATGKKGERGE